MLYLYSFPFSLTLRDTFLSNYQCRVNMRQATIYVIKCIIYTVLPVIGNIVHLQIQASHGTHFIYLNNDVILDQLARPREIMLYVQFDWQRL